MISNLYHIIHSYGKPLQGIIAYFERKRKASIYYDKEMRDIVGDKVRIDYSLDIERYKETLPQHRNLSSANQSNDVALVVYDAITLEKYKNIKCRIWSNHLVYETEMYFRRSGYGGQPISFWFAYSSMTNIINVF